jgi:cytochrome P450
VSETTIDLSDASLWARPDLAGLIGELREQAPVQRTATAQDGPVWSVLSYELACAVLNDTATYSSAGGSLLGSGAGQVPAGAGRMMALTDPPRHRELRAPVLPYFSARGVRNSASRISDLAASVIADAVVLGQVDLVNVVSAIPLVVMCELLDIPGDDREMVVKVCDEAFLGQNPDARRTAHRTLIPYLFQLAARRRADPGDDLTSALARYLINGRLLPIEDVVLNLDNVIVGGVQTVRHTAATSIWALVQHPECWRQLQAGEVSLASATDELLRWTSVGLHVLRTATRRVELGGQLIEPGEKVAVWTWAANHDPAMFDRPEAIVLDRSPNRHLALGVGPHYCVGGPLAKAELGAIYGAVLDQIAAIEPTGDPVRNQSIINFGFDHVPVRLHPR